MCAEQCSSWRRVLAKHRRDAQTFPALVPFLPELGFSALLSVMVLQALRSSWANPSVRVQVDHASNSCRYVEQVISHEHACSE
jgi:uncharacterized lipoprotein